MKEQHEKLDVELYGSYKDWYCLNGYGANYVISSKDGKTKYTSGSLCDENDDGHCELESLPQGEYVWRVSGSTCANQDNIQWEFCDVQGSAMTEVLFKVDGQGSCTVLEQTVFPEEYTREGDNADVQDEEDKDLLSAPVSPVMTSSSHAGFAMYIVLSSGFAVVLLGVAAMTGLLPKFGLAALGQDRDRCPRAAADTTPASEPSNWTHLISIINTTMKTDAAAVDGVKTDVDKRTQTQSVSHIEGVRPPMVQQSSYITPDQTHRPLVFRPAIFGRRGVETVDSSWEKIVESINSIPVSIDHNAMSRSREPV